MERIRTFYKQDVLVIFWYLVFLAKKGQFIIATYSFFVSNFMRVIVAIMIVKDQAPVYWLWYLALRALIYMVGGNYRRRYLTDAIWLRADKMTKTNAISEFGEMAAELVDKRINLFVKKGFL